jgi:hypothetical protein
VLVDVRGRCRVTIPDVTETAEQLEIQVGRRAPFTQVSDWVLLAPIRTTAKALYWALSAHINTGRNDTAVWPTQDMLAEILGLSRGDKVKTYMDELVAIDAVSVRKFRAGMRERSIYTVHQTEPTGHAGLVSLKEFYAARKANAQVARVPRNGGTHFGGAGAPSNEGAADPRFEGAADPRNGGSNQTKVNKTNENQTNVNQTKPGAAAARPQTPADSNPLRDFGAGLLSEGEFDGSPTTRACAREVNGDDVTGGVR